MPGAGFDAFISYSSAVNGEFAGRLQRWLERFATPWYRPRHLRIFRDFTSLAAHHDLAEVIEAGLSRSRSLILLASPEAAASPWVDREVSWWRANRGPADVRIVLTGGSLAWDTETGDWAAQTDAVPPAAYGMFPAEPLWVDMSALRTTRDLDRSNVTALHAVARLAAPLRGVDMDTLVGEHITHERSARRQRRGAVAVLAVLLAVAVVTSVLAVLNLRRADRQTRVATARALTGAALVNTGSDQSLANLLAAEAYRLDPTPQSRAALVEASISSPALVRYYAAGSPVTRVGASADGTVTVAGTADGRVLSWSGAGGGARELLRPGGPVTALAVSPDGRTVVAAGARPMVWTSSAGGRSIPFPAGQEPGTVAVSPDGTLAVASGRTSTVVYDVAGSRAINTEAVGGWTGLALPSSRELVGFEDAYGAWERRRLPGLARTSGATVAFGTHNFGGAISADGEFITYSNGDTVISLWSTRNPRPDLNRSELEAGSAGPVTTAVAVSRDHSHVATAANGTIHVSRAGRLGGSHTALELRGNTVVNPAALAFADDGRRLVSGSGSMVTVWDTGRLSRVATERRGTVPVSCNGCSEGWLAVSADRTAAAVVAHDGSTAHLHSLTGDRSVPLDPAPGFFGYRYGPVVAGPGGGDLLVTLPPDGRTELRDMSAARPGPSGYPPARIKAAALTPDRTRLVLVDNTNVVRVLDARDGRQLAAVTGPADPSGEAENPANVGASAVDPAGGRVAITMQERDVTWRSAWLIDIASGTVTRVPGPALRVAFGGDVLAVTRPGGAVDLLSLPGLRVRRTLPGGDSAAGAIAINRAGTLLAQVHTDGTIVIWTAAEGELLGRLPYGDGSIGRKIGLVFESDDTTLAVAVEGDDGEGRLLQWTLDPESMIRVACATAGRDLTPDEWRRHTGTDPPADLTCLR